ncbi:NAD(P)H-dependent oxidoreductase [Pseudodesulfovibrio senegalensis]|uniref:NAD(P)H-dependent oxidoreductase n=1 Tax=Pseudodesulfovibrio senegalensis TaxID=1721087 RepID=A0A6N6N0E9_9BACT|nr:NAD(P)H-dependent oxidoreductase [Pseudodesulfovibrio senegalensis]KAB1440372.1 NAD(P)H-dependent oxidoreductase [Pseudodesulfovibrio senegalensis]
MNMQSIINAYQFRHACKDFNPEKKIPEEQFEAIIEMARLSPSSFGFEQWDMLVIMNPEIREAIREIAPGGQLQIPNCSHLAVLLGKKMPIMRFDSSYIDYMLKDVQKVPDEVYTFMKEFVERFQRETFRLLDSDRAMFDWSCKQAYIALGNMLTGAALMGIDSCPMEGFDPKALNNILETRCGMDQSTHGAAVLCAFGYRVKEPRAKTRRPVEKVVRWIR